MRRRANIEGFDQIQAEASKNIHQPATFDDKDVVYRFSCKHRFSLKNNPLSGATLRQWLQVLAKYWREMELGGPYLLRIFFISALSVANSVLAIVEDILYAKAISEQELNPSPVFIVGMHMYAYFKYAYRVMRVPVLFDACIGTRYRSRPIFGARTTCIESEHLPMTNTQAHPYQRINSYRYRTPAYRHHVAAQPPGRRHR
jgi:hypothetical protein